MKTYSILIEELEKISGAKGSNPGGIYKDSDTNEEHYIKHPDNQEQAKSEVLSAKLHELLGVHTLKPELKEVNKGKLSVSSKFNHNLEPLTSKHIPELTQEHHNQLGKIFSAGVLTKNWDAAGTGIESGQGNIMKDKKHGHLVSIDQGGSFKFRAQGDHKDYDHEISEHDTLRNPKMSEGAKFFKPSVDHPETKKAIKTSLENLDMDKVHHTFENSKMKDWKVLHNTFKERHKKMLDLYSK